MRTWTPHQMGQMLDRLTRELHASNPEAESAWLLEIKQRAGTPDPAAPPADSKLLKNRQRSGLW